MSGQDNRQVVQGVFDAFGRGDIPGVLALLSEDVLWEVIGSPDWAPYYGPRRGHEGAVEFFRQLGGNVEFESFEPQEFIEGRDAVVVLGRERGRVRATGKTFEQEWAMVFTVSGGKVTGFRCYENTAAVAEAFE